MMYKENMDADTMAVADYKEIYEAIVSLSVDADGYSIHNQNMPDNGSSLA